MNHYPQPGERWLHYKGGQYEIICMCNHTDTNEPLVIYRSISFGSTYARPFSEWHDSVKSEVNEYNTNRFVKLKDE